MAAFGSGAMACEPMGAKSPMSDPKKAARDNDLVGIWRADLGDKVSFRIIGKSSGRALLPGEFELIASHWDRIYGGYGVLERTTLFSTRIGQRTYLNLVLKDGDGKTLGYLFERYEV